MINKESENYKAGWYDGYQEARKGVPPTTTIPTIPFPHKTAYAQHCTVCGIKFEHANQYVCSNYSCPNKLTVTCVSNTTAITNSTLNNMSDNNMSMLKPVVLGTIPASAIKISGGT